MYEYYETAAEGVRIRFAGPADVPVILLECDALDAPQAGELLYFFELANAICAAASGVDPLASAQSGPARTLAGQLLGKPE